MTIRHGKIVSKNILSDTDFYVPVCNGIYCFKLLSQGPHKAVHTLRKQPQNESSTLQQMKLVKELCNSSKIFYSRAIRKEIQHKFERLGFVKAHQAVFVIKDLLQFGKPEHCVTQTRHDRVLWRQYNCQSEKK